MADRYLYFVLPGLIGALMLWARELGLTLEALGRGDEAKEYYQRILDDHPQSPHSIVARQKTASS